MRYLLSNLPLPIGREAWSLSRVLSDTLGLPETDFSYIRLERRSLDARHKGSIRFLVALSFDSDSEVPQEFVPPGVQLTLATPSLPFLVNPLSQKGRVVIVGSGPAGTFCALRCLDYGLQPIILERGPSMSDRVAGINALWKEAQLKPNANAQFGEGGAGTFSDGKLTTRIGHPATRYVIDTFVR